jgi:peroxiredoxin
MRLAGFGLALAVAAGVALAAAPPASEYEIAPDFTLRDVGGEEVNLYTLLQYGPVYLECWDLPCVNCIAELDALVPVYDSLFPRGLQLIALSVDKASDEGRVKAFVKSKKWPFWVLLDQQQAVKKLYNIIIKPTAYLINMNGEIVYTHIGYKKGDEVRIRDELLKWLPPPPADSSGTEE